MKRVLILGGGFGGISTAHHLRLMLDSGDEIVLVDRGTHFMMGFHKTSIVVGRTKPDEPRRALASLAARGIDVRRATIDAIDPAARAATIGGERIEADALVVALGADLAPGAIGGLADHGINIYDTDGAERARDALASVDEGRVVIGVFGAPYKCPPAPFELALLANDAAKERGARLKFTVFSPLPMSIPALGAAGCNPLETRIASEGIEFRPNTKASGVEAGRVVLAEGAGEISFDVLLAVPPHRCPVACVEAGLAPQGGWIKVDPRTLETQTGGVWAVGDATAIPLSNGQALPKAGALADEEGRVVASRIAARFSGREPGAQFSGEGSCFLEIGGGQAMLVQGRFFADPPSVVLTSPSAEALKQKEEFERERLDAWFGPA